MIDAVWDERYSVADEAIYDAFFEILKEKTIDKITVSDVIKRAGVVRSTFYNHYENIPALVNAIEDKTIEDIFSLMESFHPKNDHDICRSYFLAVCNYTQTNPFLAELLCSPRVDEFFRKAITMFHQYVTEMTQSVSSKNQSPEELSYLIASVIGCTIGILHKWTRENFHVPAEKIADLLSQIFISGMLPLMSSKSE